MGLNYRKRIRLGKFINLNLGKRGAGFSFGIPGARISVNSQGRKQASIGIPGTGLYYTKSLGTRSKKKEAATKASHATNSYQQQDALNAYQNALYALSHIHTEAYDFLDFEADPIEYVTRERGPLQKEAISKLENFKPSFFDRLLKKDVKKYEQLQEDVFKAIEDDEENRTIHQVDDQLAQGLKKNQPKAMNEFIKLVGGFDVFSDDAISHKIDYVMNVDEASAIIINVTTDMKEDVLDNVVNITDKGNYSTKKLSKTALNERCYAYICSLALGYATEALAITPLYKALINITDTSLNESTGLRDLRVILAGEFDENQLIQYDYENLNPIEVVEKSSVEMNFTPRNGFKEVAPIGQNN